MKARSELVLPRNFPDGGVLERTRRFHTASCAFIRPALRPIRGSGLGGEVDMLTAGLAAGAGAFPPPVVEGWPQAVAARTERAKARCTERMKGSSSGAWSER